jgi:hypothetical protein
MNKKYFTDKQIKVLEVFIKIIILLIGVNMLLIMYKVWG